MKIKERENWRENEILDLNSVIMANEVRVWLIYGVLMTLKLGLGLG